MKKRLRGRKSRKGREDRQQKEPEKQGRPTAEGAGKAGKEPAAGKREQHLKKIKHFAEAIITPCVLYLLAVMPRVVHRPDTALFHKRYFAHRGLHDNAGDAPENSMPAFRKAVEAGYGIELDVHVTKDAVPVVFHDHTLERMCGGSGTRQIRDYTYAELGAFTLGNSDERIPKLEDVLLMVRGRVPLIVEIKSEDTDISLCAPIDELLRAYDGEYCIEAFNPMVLLWFRRHHNEVVRGQLASDLRRDGEYKSLLAFLLTHLLFNFLTKPDFIAYNHEFRQEPGRRICRKLYRNPSAAWTVKSREKLREVQGEFDIFIFESFTP